MIKVLDVPHGIKEIHYRYGNPDHDKDGILDPYWYAENIRFFPVPFPLFTGSGDPVRRLALHQDVGPAVIDALEDFIEEIGIYTIQDNHWNITWGGFYFKHQTGSNGLLSTHAFGCAVDMFPNWGPYGEMPAEMYPMEFVDMMKARGFEWGGDWPKMNSRWPYDGMHFQACTGY